MKAIAECSEMDKSLFDILPPVPSEFVRWRLDFRCKMDLREREHLAHEATDDYMRRCLDFAPRGPVCIDIMLKGFSPADGWSDIAADIKFRVPPSDYIESSSTTSYTIG